MGKDKGGKTASQCSTCPGKKCASCDGTGRWLTKNEPCGHCSGSGQCPINSQR